ncbi:MAG: hypothetical protein GZ091_16310 [Paludibacter sp.]|nr:hypothetical protein [Paludibacter sp.]
MKKIAIIGNLDYGQTVFSNRKKIEVDSVELIQEDSTVIYDFEIKNYHIEPLFIPNLKIRSKYKRNLKYK